MADQTQDTVQLTANGAIPVGSVAQKLVASNMNVNALRTNDVLMKDEWVQFDETVVQVARARMTSVGALMSMGLTYQIGGGLGTTVVQWDKASDMSPANVSMSGVTPGERDRMLFTLQSMPLPITHKEFSINIRNLIATRRGGSRLDTSQAALAARLVAEKTEQSLYVGSTVQAGGGVIYGLTTEPNRNTGSLQSGGWAAGATTGDHIIANVLTMVAALETDNMYGPYELHVSYDAWNKLQNDFKANSDRTILERILAISSITAVRPTPFLTGGTNNQVVLFQTTSDVIDIVEGLQPTTVQWDSEGGMTANFKVMSILVPRVKSDANNQSGVAHFTA